MAYRLLARFDNQTLRASLRQVRNILGSSPTCDVCLPHPTVSRRHAALTVTPSGIELEDLNSTNGTLVRSQRIERTMIRPADIFVLGRVVILLEEVTDDDLEVAIPLDGQGIPQKPPAKEEKAPERTQSFSVLDQFSLDYLPRLLDQLCGEIDRQRLAPQVGQALFDILPVTAVEISEIGTPEKGILYATERQDDSVVGSSWVEAATSECQVRVNFFKDRAGKHFLPIVESAVRLLTLAGREARADLPPQPKPPKYGDLSPPQPLSVEPEVQRIYEEAARVARGDVGVLIIGESGTGKEVLARFIHNASPRSSQALVAINCASLPRDLLEAELFGVEKGVATGVEARAGKFEAADQGTIFLDEIGDMAQETQAKILRVLQEKEVFRIGGHTPRPARARVIAATNRPIQKMIAEGTFRSDLYHRIATWEVELPPLRRRRGDIPNLVAYFLAREARRYGIRVNGISRAALMQLRRYSWPGNIRQLRNEVSRAVLFLEEGELLDTSRLSPTIRGEQQGQTGRKLSDILEGVERDEIIMALEATKGDTATAAQNLQISRPTLYRRIKSLEIDLSNLVSKSN